jgi:acetyl-CoA carboxylase carboxyltransferase component
MCGQGVVAPQDIGPMPLQVPNGRVDLLVPYEEAAVGQYLPVLRHAVRRRPAAGRDFLYADQRVLRHLIPENRVRSSEVQLVIQALCDTGSALERRPVLAPACSPP